MMSEKMNCCCGGGRICPSHGDSTPGERPSVKPSKDPKVSVPSAEYIDAMTPLSGAPLQVTKAKRKLNTWCKGIALPDGSYSGCVCDCPTCAATALRLSIIARSDQRSMIAALLMEDVKAKDQTLQSLDRSLEFIYKVVTKVRERLGPAGLDGHLNSIGGVVLQMRDWIKASLPNTPPTG